MPEKQEQKRDPHTAGLRTDTLGDSILILLALTGLQRGIGFVRAVLFCRWLDPEQLGRWDMAFSFLMMAAPLSVLALSSSFNRYAEHYRQRNQLRTFFARTGVAYVLLALLAVSVIVFFPAGFSKLMFGSADSVAMVRLVGLGLLAVIFHHYFLDLFSSLRNVRLVAALQMANSFLFAVLGVGLLLFWRTDAAAVVTAYGLACALCTVAGIVWLVRTWHCLPQADQSPSQRAFWRKLLPFVGWISLSSMMGNLFDVADRYMIVHYSAGGSEHALGQVGTYHSCRIVPLLLVSVAAMVAGIVTPHLSHDWESGRRDQAKARLRLLMKLFGFGLCAAAVAALAAGPLLFSVVFDGKFTGGMAVLPLTLMYCVWFALFGFLQIYAWCRERAYLGSLALGVGLVVNVALNLVLLPRMGLMGAVLATATANLLAIVLLAVCCQVMGFSLGRPVWVVFALPLVIVLGPWIAGLVLAVVAIEAAFGRWLLSPEEKTVLADGFFDYLKRFRKLRAKVGSLPAS